MEKKVSSPEIIYEDSNIIVLNKPALWHSVDSTKSKNNSIAAWLIKKDPSFKGVSDKEEEGGLVHRLDYETSGVLIAAKTRDSYKALRGEFKANNVIKEYLAIVEDKFLKEVTHKSYIGTNARSGSKVYSYETEKPRTVFSVSHFSPFKYNKDKNLSLVKIQIETGSRHQIRVHLKDLHCPIVGDLKYGSKTSIEGVPHFILHSYQIKTLGHTFVATPPEYIKELFGSF